MATVESGTLAPGVREAQNDIPELCAGDRLTRAEFERRYAAMPHIKKAELIEGVVYMPSPVSHNKHARPHGSIVAWVATYAAATPGTDFGDNGTVRLDLENEPQPDAMLRVLPECGGQTRDDEDYIGGAPELVAEVAASSASYDLHDKLRAYQRNGVREYIVWRVREAAIDWFVLRDARFEKLLPDASGFVKSETFPGLWLDPAAMIAGDLGRALAPATGDRLCRARCLRSAAPSGQCRSEHLNPRVSRRPRVVDRCNSRRLQFRVLCRPLGLEGRQGRGQTAVVLGQVGIAEGHQFDFLGQLFVRDPPAGRVARQPGGGQVCHPVK